MTWPALAPNHFGHRAVLRALDLLECVDCGHKLVLPLRPDLAPTPTPEPWTRPADGVPMPEQLRAGGWRKAVVAQPSDHRPGGAA